MGELIAEYSGIFFAAAVKFLPTPFLALNALGFSYWETILVTSSGGITGVSFFYLAADFLMSRSRKKRLEREEKLKAAGKFKPKRKFTRINKLVIKVKWTLGLWGLAILTPAVLSIPIGCIVSAKFYSHNRFMLLYLIMSVILSSFVITTAAYLLENA